MSFTLQVAGHTQITFDGRRFDAGEVITDDCDDATFGELAEHVRTGAIEVHSGTRPRSAR